MPECDRCGRSTENGATLEPADPPFGLLCVVCVSWVEEVEVLVRGDQAGLEDYA